MKNKIIDHNRYTICINLLTPATLFDLHDQATVYLTVYEEITELRFFSDLLPLPYVCVLVVWTSDFSNFYHF